MPIDTTPIIFQNFEGKWVVCVMTGVHNLEFDICYDQHSWKRSYLVQESHLNEVIEFAGGPRATYESLDEAFDYAWELYDYGEANEQPQMLTRVLLANNATDVYYVFRLIPLEETKEDLKEKLLKYKGLLRSFCYCNYDLRFEFVSHNLFNNLLGCGTPYFTTSLNVLREKANRYMMRMDSDCDDLAT